MKQKPIQYCESCTKKILRKWKGWPHKDAVPLLPKLVDGICPKCGEKSILENEKITWFNYHGEYNSGLPDFWLLQIDGITKKWGHPYFCECKCNTCGETAIVSEMNYPNGTHEFKCNCENCGISNITEIKQK